VGDGSHFVFCQKLLGEDGSVRLGVVMVKQPGLFSPDLSSEPIGMSYNHFLSPQQCREWSNVDPDGQGHEFVQQFQKL
jgi:hypothetical protein